MGIKDKRRPCIVRGKKGLFHCWATEDIQTNNNDVIHYTCGIIELEDGSIKTEHPHDIKFVHSGIENFYFKKED